MKNVISSIPFLSLMNIAFLAILSLPSSLAQTTCIEKFADIYGFLCIVCNLATSLNCLSALQKAKTEKRSNFIFPMFIAGYFTLHYWKIMDSFRELFVVFVAIVYKTTKAMGDKVDRTCQQKEEVIPSSQNWLNLINEAYFLCDNHLTLCFKNRKAQEVLDNCYLPFTAFAKRLTEAQDSKKTLKSTVTKLFEEISCDTIIAKKFTLFEKESKKENEFPRLKLPEFKARITKLPNDLVLIVLRECNKSSNSTATSSVEFRTLSYDLKSLLHGIVGYLELIKEGISLDGKLFYDLALSSTKLLENKLNDFVDFLHVRNKTLELHSSQFSISELLNEVFTICEWPAKQKQIELKVKKDGAYSELILGDRSRIKQVLLNIASKAVDLTDNGKITISAYYKNQKIGFRVRSMGPCVQLKFLTEGSLPSSSKRKYSLATVPVEETSYLNRMHLEISQIICHEIGATLCAKVLREYSDLKFLLFNKKEPCKTRSPQEKQVRRFTGSSKSQQGLVVKCINVYNVTMTPKPLSKFAPIRQEQYEEINAEIADEGKVDDRILVPILPKVLIKCSSGTPSFISKKKLLPKEDAANFRRKISDDGQRIRTASDFTTLLGEYNKINAKKTYISRLSFDEMQESNSVLIVDDNATNRFVLNGLMKKYGYYSIEAKDGRDSLNFVETAIKVGKVQDLKLILMDLQMPIMNGVEATQKIISACLNAGFKAPPIIGISADSSEEDRKKFLKSGIKEFMSKPIDAKKVQHLIEKYITKKI